jgi:hypothetical protein
MMMPQRYDQVRFTSALPQINGSSILFVDERRHAETSQMGRGFLLWPLFFGFNNGVFSGHFRMF